jgi:hypothetical protein
MSALSVTDDLSGYAMQAFPTPAKKAASPGVGQPSREAACTAPVLAYLCRHSRRFAQQRPWCPGAPLRSEVVRVSRSGWSRPRADRLEPPKVRWDQPYFPRTDHSERKRDRFAYLKRPLSITYIIPSGSARPQGTGPYTLSPPWRYLPGSGLLRRLLLPGRSKQLPTAHSVLRIAHPSHPRSSRWGLPRK